MENNFYGLGLKLLFENNKHDQIIALLMIQNYSQIHNFIKITYKSNSPYLIRMMFQLLFTYDIVEEETYWEWEEYIQTSNDFDENTIKKILLQTTEFFMILKTVFYDDDNQENNDDEETNKFINTNKTLNNIVNPV
jgi:hypothetical protein